MSKRNNDGDVIFNQVAVGLARQQQRLASLFGGGIASAAAVSHDEQPAEQATTSLVELKGEGDDEGFGLGAIVPKEVQDGSFTNRIPTSHERLLENLIGKKAARAHIAAKQKHTAVTKPQKPAKPIESKDESDEEEGRSAAFRSKRQRHTNPVSTRNDSSDEGEETRASNIVVKKQKVTRAVSTTVNDEDMTVANAQNKGETEESAEATSDARPSRPKPKSYLDEILGERSRKKNKKKKGKETGM